MNTRNIAVGMLVPALAFWLALPAAAEKSNAERGGACAAEAAKFCKDVKPGEGRVKACLAEHKKELSAACTERLEKGKSKKGKFHARGRGGKAMACSGAFEKGFSRGFVRGAKMGGFGRKAAFRQAKAGRAGLCKADAERLCKDVKPGEGRVKACLRQNLDKLSGGCKARQEKALGKEKAAEKNAKA